MEYYGVKTLSPFEKKRLKKYEKKKADYVLLRDIFVLDKFLRKTDYTVSIIIQNGIEIILYKNLDEVYSEKQLEFKTELKFNFNNEEFVIRVK